MLSFLRSFPCGTSGEEVRQVTEVGEEGNGDIAEDNDDDGMDQGNGNTALEHFIGIQAIADRHGTDTDGQEPLGVEGHTGQEPVGQRIQAHLGGDADDQGADDGSCRSAVGDLGDEAGKDDQADDGGQAAVQIDAGDHIRQAVRGAGAVEELADGQATGEEDHHAPHGALLSRFPGHDCALILHTEEEAGKADGQEGVSGDHTGQQLGVEGTGEGQDHGQEEEDADTLAEAKAEVESIQKDLDDMEIQTLLDGEYDYLSETDVFNVGSIDMGIEKYNKRQQA